MIFSKLKRTLSLRLLWDLFMVWVALINLSMILFDMTYLILRPLYFTYVPVVARIYDPVLGIKPHFLTEELIEEADAASQLIALDPQSAKLEEHLAKLDTLTLRVLLENPFERSGQTHNLDVIRAVIARETDHTSDTLHLPEMAARAAREFWSADLDLLRHRLALFESEIRPLLAVNYFREYDLNGHLEDRFWMLDLPFLILFWIEFMARWVITWKRREYAKWFFFPILNWYDVLGLIPSGYFRVFRLLRAVSMYMRLRRSELSVVGRDFISRSVAYISNIITEEISDMVSLRILTEYQQEIRNGTHRRIINETFGTRRAELEQILAGQIRDVLIDSQTLENLRSLLRLNLENAVEQSQTLHAVPLPKAVVKPVVRSVGEIILDTTLETITTTLESEEGELIVQNLVTGVIDQFVAGPGLDEVESIGAEISLDVIEHMKESVAVKKWALPSDTSSPDPYEAD